MTCVKSIEDCDRSYGWGVADAITFNYKHEPKDLPKRMNYLDQAFMSGTNIYLLDARASG
jgi:hypothetical protein